MKSESLRSLSKVSFIVSPKTLLSSITTELVSLPSSSSTEDFVSPFFDEIILEANLDFAALLLDDLVFFFPDLDLSDFPVWF
jgi:hypothetical protein